AAIDATDGGLQCTRVALELLKSASVSCDPAIIASGAPNALASELTSTTHGSRILASDKDPPPPDPYGVSAFGSRPMIPRPCVSSITPRPSRAATQSTYERSGAAVPHATQNPSATNAGLVFVLAIACHNAFASCRGNFTTGAPSAAARSTPHVPIGYRPSSTKRPKPRRDKSGSRS